MAKSKSENKKKPLRVAAGPEAPGFARSLGENIGRFIRVCTPLVLLLSGGALVSFILWRPIYAEPNAASGDSRGLLTAKTIRCAVMQKPAPPWIMREDLEQVANLGLFARNHMVFESNLSQTLARQYERSPWVERVSAVKLRYPAQMDVDIEWRKPCARIDRPGMVLDRHGVVLNLLPDSVSVRDIPVISGVPSSRTEAGRQVAEKDLLDAVGLFAVVRDQLLSSPGNLKIAAIQLEPSRMWRIVTDRGPSILWGTFSDDPPQDEPRTAEKANLLHRRLCEIKDPSLLESIKVCFPNAPATVRLQGSHASANNNGARTYH